MRLLQVDERGKGNEGLEGRKRRKKIGCHKEIDRSVTETSKLRAEEFQQVHTLFNPWLR